MNRGHHGDSAGSRVVDCSLKSRSSHHVFNAAGENVQYYSDSESLGTKKNKTRYINPAIYVEPADSARSSTSLQTDPSSDNLTPHPHVFTSRSNSTPFLTSRVTTATPSTKRKSCRLGGSVGGASEKTPREKTPRTYREDGNDTFRLSVASVSTTNTAKEEHARNEQKKREAFKVWLARKEQETTNLQKREKERLEKLKRDATPLVTPEQREQAFHRWMEQKRVQEERRRAEELARRCRESERLERERMRRDRDKQEKLAEWVRRKEEAIKGLIGMPIKCEEMVQKNIQCPCTRSRVVNTSPSNKEVPGANPGHGRIR
ncbi:hypothetical protein EVAR_20955_1 [Eumeta japonica]|uniref:Coiled-coil domain-containing protein 34 n=1 Tax=Eumeta variegata TaxID=151549 RepID=A0A4C1V715_EUMVA|nr:hypothetical protein EVAR_20955_1 [Eumeta japonica]